MSRVRFECVPCGTTPSVSVLEVTLTPAPSVELTCPVCSAFGRVAVTASVWWQLVVMKAGVLEELDQFAAELDRVSTPADIGGGL